MLACVVGHTSVVSSSWETGGGQLIGEGIAFISGETINDAREIGEFGLNQLDYLLSAVFQPLLTYFKLEISAIEALDEPVGSTYNFTCSGRGEGIFI